MNEKNIEEESLNSKKILIDCKRINLDNYEKEEGSGFYYQKDIDFSNKKYKLIGSGCRYKMCLAVYSVGMYCSNVPKELIIENSIQKILLSDSKKILLLKMYREIDILTMTSALNSAFKKRIDAKNKENKKIVDNLIYFEWILKKFIPNGLQQHDELVFEWDNSKINIYIGKNTQEIDSSYFYSKIKDNLTPSNKLIKIGEVDDINICKILFDCYLDKNSVTSNIKYSINRFIVNLSGIDDIEKNKE